MINIINFNNNYTIGGILLNNSNKSDKNQWRSPLNSTTLNNIFKSYTPKYNKNFILNMNYSLMVKESREERKVKDLNSLQKPLMLKESKEEKNIKDQNSLQKQTKKSNHLNYFRSPRRRSR